MDKAKAGSVLRIRILAFLGAVIILSLVGFTSSLVRITQVNRELDSINREAVPVGRVLAELGTDAEVFKREIERSAGIQHWKDPHWRPKPLPSWLVGIVSEHFSRLRDADAWVDDAWLVRTEAQYLALVQDVERLQFLVGSSGTEHDALQVWQKIASGLDALVSDIKSGKESFDAGLKRRFSELERQVANLRTGLQLIVVSVIALSLLLFWLGDRALKPLNELTRLARRVAERGELTKDDKLLLPEYSLARTDEVTALAREFHRMATQLVERDAMLKTQSSRLQESNDRLQTVSRFTANILRSMRSAVVATDAQGRITQCNPAGLQMLQTSEAEVMGTRVNDWVRLAPLWDETCGSAERKVKQGDRQYIVQQERLPDSGTLLVIEDVTEREALSERLKRAENLATVGRMSAQVAHEIRNPLHSIGLEAEMALERASDPQARESIRSILGSVEKLEEITNNYLQLTRVQSSESSPVDLRELVTSVLGTYMPSCEALRIQVDWRFESPKAAIVAGDRRLLEQALGNLIRNSIQALEAHDGGRRIELLLLSLESGKHLLRVSDTGPGLSPAVRARLFEPFVTTKAQGSGLGLSFVKQVIESAGGTISAHTGSSTGGAVFEIRLPADPGEVHRGIDATV